MLGIFLESNEAVERVVDSDVVDDVALSSLIAFTCSDVETEEMMPISINYSSRVREVEIYIYIYLTGNKKRKKTMNAMIHSNVNTS